MFRSKTEVGQISVVGLVGRKKKKGISLGLGSTKRTGVIGPIWGTCASDLKIKVSRVEERSRLLKVIVCSSESTSICFLVNSNDKWVNMATIL